MSGETAAGRGGATLPEDSPSPRTTRREAGGRRALPVGAVSCLSLGRFFGQPAIHLFESSFCLFRLVIPVVRLHDSARRDNRFIPEVPRSSYGHPKRKLPGVFLAVGFRDMTAARATPVENHTELFTELSILECRRSFLARPVTLGAETVTGIRLKKESSRLVHSVAAVLRDCFPSVRDRDRNRVNFSPVCFSSRRTRSSINYIS